MSLTKPVYKTTLKVLFLLTFLTLSLLHIKNILKFDAISLTLILFGMIPILLPFLNNNFRSFELFGIKAELLEKKIAIQEEDLKKQQRIIHELVIYSMAFYLYQMLCDFDKCQSGEMKEYIFKKSSSFENNLRYLRDNGYLEMTFKIASLSDGENIAQKVKLTPIGKFYINLRSSYKKTEQPQ